MKRIALTRGKVSLVSNSDFRTLSRFKWTAAFGANGWWAYRKTVGGKSVYMHREILKCPEGLEVNHKNHDGLDNRRCNIRICAKWQNNGNSRLASHNTSGFKGVRFHNGKWEANISRSNHTFYLGSFSRAKDAAKAYDKSAKKYFGKFSLTNKKLGLL